MSLSEGYTQYTMQDIPMEARDIMSEILKNMKLQQSIACNKNISTKTSDIIVFRNWHISWIELIIQLLSTQPPPSGVSILDRQKKSWQTKGN